MPKHSAAARDRALYWGLWCLLLAIAWLAYAPGLTGGFLFDDFVNLPALGDMGPIDDADAFWRYLTSGMADPIGRPLSLLSFLVDARDWPADPAPFLRSNLILHLANGWLLLLLLRHLGRTLDPADPRESWAALLGAGLWLLHPLFVSTTMYIVQREAMLPALFMLTGLLAYGRGRLRFAASQGREGMAWMAGGIALGTSLALLCKANGMLLPLLAWVLEATLYSRQPMDSPQAITRLRKLKAVWLGLPSLVVLAYVSSYLLHWNYPSRGWTIGQRALTEPRALLDYLGLLAVPRSVSSGLYNDNYLASTDFLHPVSTLPSLLLVAGLIAAAVHWRRYLPAWSAAVLFFFAGHLLESTVVPLELYFEHRNYLPALLLFWPLARVICRSARSPALRATVASLLILLLATTTWQRTAYWGKPERLSAIWAAGNPDSSRAQATAAAAEVRAGKPELAALRLRPLWQQNPKDLQLALNYVNAACHAGGLSTRDLDLLATTLRTADIGALLVRQWIEKAIGIAKTGRCPGLDLDAVEGLLDAARHNPAINTPLAQEKSMPPLLAMLALERGDADLALKNFNRALAANVAPETAAGQAVMLASRGHYRQALEHLDLFDRIKHEAPAPRPGMQYVHALVLERQQYWPKELALLRSRIRAEMQPSGAAR